MCNLKEYHIFQIFSFFLFLKTYKNNFYLFSKIHFLFYFVSNCFKITTIKKYQEILKIVFKPHDQTYSKFFRIILKIEYFL